MSSKLVANWSGTTVQSLANIQLVSDHFKPDQRTFNADILLNCVEQTVLLPVAELSHLYHASAIFQLIHAIKRNPKIRQIYVWATVLSISNDVLVPFLEHMANVVVTLKDVVNLSVLTKKSSGSVSKKVKIKISCGDLTQNLRNTMLALLIPDNRRRYPCCRD